jgi:hypothetical protein
MKMGTGLAHHLDSPVKPGNDREQTFLGKKVPQNFTKSLNRPAAAILI